MGSDMPPWADGHAVDAAAVTLADQLSAALASDLRLAERAAAERLYSEAQQLWRDGRRADSLATMSECIDAFRALVVAVPTHKAALATALNDFSIDLAAMGGRKEALAVVNESIQLLTQLVEADIEPRGSSELRALRLKVLANRELLRAGGDAVSDPFQGRRYLEPPK
jgi:hypothetical protein